jgi:hypothetical protein
MSSFIRLLVGDQRTERDELQDLSELQGGGSIKGISGRLHFPFMRSAIKVVRSLYVIDSGVGVIRFHSFCGKVHASEARSVHRFLPE